MYPINKKWPLQPAHQVYGPAVRAHHYINACILLGEIHRYCDQRVRDAFFCPRPISFTNMAIMIPLQAYQPPPAIEFIARPDHQPELFFEDLVRLASSMRDLMGIPEHRDLVFAEPKPPRPPIHHVEEWGFINYSPTTESSFDGHRMGRFWMDEFPMIYDPGHHIMIDPVPVANFFRRSGSRPSRKELRDLRRQKRNLSAYRPLHFFISCIAHYKENRS